MLYVAFGNQEHQRRGHFVDFIWLDISNYFKEISFEKITAQKKCLLDPVEVSLAKFYNS